MNRRALPLAVVLLCLASPALRAQHQMGIPMEPDPAPKASDLTVAQLLAKHAEARGGRLKAIQSVTMTGTWVTTQSKSSPTTVTIAPGHYLRRIDQADSSGKASFKAVNGANAGDHPTTRRFQTDSRWSPRTRAAIAAWPTRRGRSWIRNEEEQG